MVYLQVSRWCAVLASLKCFRSTLCGKQVENYFTCNVNQFRIVLWFKCLIMSWHNEWGTSNLGADAEQGRMRWCPYCQSGFLKSRTETWVQGYFKVSWDYCQRYLICADFLQMFLFCRRNLHSGCWRLDGTSLEKFPYSLSKDHSTLCSCISVTEKIQ